MNNIFRTFIPSAVRKYYRAGRDERRLEQIKRQYKGTAVECPFCKSTFSAFGPFGSPQRSNAMCHECRALERHRLIYLYLRDRFDFFNPSHSTVSLLHFAPEKAFFDTFSVLPHIKYTPCDLDPEQYQFGQDVILQADITNLSFDDRAFDFILCSHVLEHVPDDRRAISELFRVMKPGGQGIFQVPIDQDREHTYEDPSITSPEARTKAFGQFDHVRLYGRDYTDRLAEAGFIVKPDEFARQFTDDEVRRYGLLKSEKIFYCER